MSAELHVSDGAIALTGPLTAFGVGALWQKAVRAARAARGENLSLDLSGVTMLDTSGAALILTMEFSHGGKVTIGGADERGAALLAQLRKAMPGGPCAQIPKTVPQRGPGLFADTKIRVTFFGETIIAMLGLAGKLRFLRGSDFLRIADRAGLQALSLVLMLGFLIGLILAFQSAIPMQQYGAEIYVASLVSISLFRELGPLLVAVILSGRTGSAFAAELGTMKVNEEVAALVTMGIDPETMLVLPRMAATMLVMPGLVVAMDLAGLLGMGVVLMVLGFPPAAIINQITSTSGPADFIEGLCKGIVFAAAVALIGCRAGLTAGNGPRAVGEAATSAVVGGIVATILLDGLFAVMFYKLGL